MRVTLLDGPVGTELARRGVPTPLPLWSAAAIEQAPEALARIHADYAAAGATVHTANTFRTDAWTLGRLGLGDRWQELTAKAVAIARGAVPDDHRVAGSISPLEDCYRPDLSPPAAVWRVEHGRSVRALGEAGVDLLLCETFPHPGEALAALDAALEVGLPVWLALTPGPFGDLLTDAVILETLDEAARRGAEAVLVNCSRPERLSRLIPRLVEGAGERGAEVGAYGNVGEPDDEVGWRNEGPARPEPYAAAAVGWAEAGASIVGGCCGTTPEHIAALAEALRRSSPTGR